MKSTNAYYEQNNASAAFILSIDCIIDNILKNVDDILFLDGDKKEMEKEDVLITRSISYVVDVL